MQYTSSGRTGEKKIFFLTPLLPSCAPRESQRQYAQMSQPERNSSKAPRAAGAPTGHPKPVIARSPGRCVCVCVCVCVFARARARICMCARARAHAHLRACARALTFGKSRADLCGVVARDRQRRGSVWEWGPRRRCVCGETLKSQSPSIFTI